MLRNNCAGVSEKSYLCGSTHHINDLAVAEPERTFLFRSMFSDISGTKSGRSVTTTSALYARKYKISLQAILLSLSTCCTEFPFTLNSTINFELCQLFKQFNLSRDTDHNGANPSRYVIPVPLIPVNPHVNLLNVTKAK